MENEEDKKMNEMKEVLYLMENKEEKKMNEIKEIILSSQIKDNIYSLFGQTSANFINGLTKILGELENNQYEKRKFIEISKR